MDPQAALRVLTEACEQLHSSPEQANRVLEDFRQSSRPFEVCKYCIDHGEATVQFQAVTAMRDAAMREWDVMEEAARLELVEWLLGKSLGGGGGGGRASSSASASSSSSSASSASSLVRRQMGSSLALILKRMWGGLDGQKKEGLLRHIAEARDTELMQAIVVEFNPSTTSAMGVMSWEYHYACKMDLEASFLPQILTWTLECIGSSCASGFGEVGGVGGVGGDDGGAASLSSSLSLLSALLLWDHNTAYLKGAVVELSVRPPENWRGILLAGSEQHNGLYGMLESVRGAIRAAGAAVARTVVATRQAYLQVVNNLAAMHGKILEDPGYKQRHIAQVFKLVLPELFAMAQVGALAARGAAAPATAAQQVGYLNANADMVLGACRALASMCSTHSLKDVAGGMRCLETMDAWFSPAAVVGTLGSCTVAVLQGSIDGNGRDFSDAAEECADIMLDVWTELSADYDVAGHLGPDLYPQFAASAGDVFAMYLAKQLHTAAMEAFEDEEDFEGDEEAYSDAVLSGLASVARASHAVSLSKLVESLERSTQRLQEASSRGTDPSVPLEELCWLLRMSSYVMADSGDGETPLVPQTFVDGMSLGTAMPLVGMSQTVLKLATDFKASIDTAIASSRLMEELCKALGRWAETYLIPSPMSSGVDWTGYVFGAEAEGPSVLNFLVELVHLCFVKFPGDRSLHLVATQNLLKPLTKHERTHQALSQSYAWQELYKAYVQESDATKALEAEVQLHLTSAICAGYNQFPDCIRELIAWQVKRLQHHAALSKNEFERADRVAYTCNVLSSLRGAARAGCNKSQPLVFGEMKPCFPAILDILSMSKDHTIVYNNVLELAADVFEYHASYLSDEDSRGLFSWAIELIRRHSADKVLYNAKNAVLTSNAFDNECDALVSIIRLLTQVTNAETCRHEDIATTVFSGVETIMPLLTQESLKVPQLRHAFFHLLTYMVEAYAPKVAELSPQSFASFLQAIAFGLQVHDDSETGSAVFEAIAAFAKHSIMCRMRGGQGLGANEETLIEGKLTLVYLFDAIVDKVVFEDAGANSLDMASEPMLYIMAHDGAAFAEHLKVRMAGNLGAVGDASTMDALHQLAGAVAAAQSLDRPARQGFSAVFKSAVTVLRGKTKK